MEDTEWYFVLILVRNLISPLLSCYGRKKDFQFLDQDASYLDVMSLLGVLGATHHSRRGARLLT